jgi:transposase
VIRKTMRFVPVKTAEQQAAAMVLKSRALLVGQRTQAVNALRAHLAELGIVSAAGLTNVAALMAVVRDESDARLPTAARFALTALADQIDDLADQIDRLERAILTEARADLDMRRLITIPGVGVITAATIKALVPDPGGFKSARHFAAWLGLTPKPHSSGGKERLGGISKMGDVTLRSLLVVGATSVLRVARKDARARPWLKALLARRPFKVAAVALANKMARIVWALLNKGGNYRPSEPAAVAAIAVQ